MEGKAFQCPLLHGAATVGQCLPSECSLCLCTAQLQAPNPADSFECSFIPLAPPPTPHPLNPPPPVYKINQVSAMLSCAVSSASILVKLLQQGQPAAFSERTAKAEECAHSHPCLLTGLQSMKSLQGYYITSFPNDQRRHMATVISLVIKVIECWSITVGIV